MNLPFEIRVMVYRYLVPNIFREDMRLSPALRDDGLCYPGILRTSRQIYKEAIYEFYGQVFFRASIVTSGFHIHGSSYSLHSRPPSTLRHIRMLDLSIYLSAPNMWDTVGSRRNSLSPRRHYNYTPFLRLWLARGPEPIRLQKLRLRFVLSFAFIEAYKGQLSELRAALNQQLSPLRAVRGLWEVSIHSINALHPMMHSAPSGRKLEFMKPVRDILEVFRDFLGVLVAEMMSPDSLRAVVKPQDPPVELAYCFSQLQGATQLMSGDKLAVLCYPPSAMYMG